MLCGLHAPNRSQASSDEVNAAPFHNPGCSLDLDLEWTRLSPALWARRRRARSARLAGKVCVCRCCAELRRQQTRQIARDAARARYPIIAVQDRQATRAVC
eukprot:5370872-Pleurochrysis_carterae.AAC.4